MASVAGYAVAEIVRTSFGEATYCERRRDYRNYLTHILEEVPTALFVAMTLMWVITSIGGLVW